MEWTGDRKGSTLLTISIRIPDGNRSIKWAASDLVRRRDDLTVMSLESGGSLYVYVDPRKGLERRRKEKVTE